MTTSSCAASATSPSTPSRSRLAVSSTTNTSGSRGTCAGETTVSMSGSHLYDGGTAQVASPQVQMTSVPRLRSTRANASIDPSASPSGATWHTRVAVRAPSRARTAADHSASGRSVARASGFVAITVDMPVGVGLACKRRTLGNLMHLLVGHPRTFERLFDLSRVLGNGIEDEGEGRRVLQAGPPANRAADDALRTLQRVRGVLAHVVVAPHGVEDRCLAQVRRHSRISDGDHAKARVLDLSLDHVRDDLADTHAHPPCPPLVRHLAPLSVLIAEQPLPRAEQLNFWPTRHQPLAGVEHLPAVRR